MVFGGLLQPQIILLGGLKLETIATKKAIDKVVIEFLEDKIITRFGVPTKITIDNCKSFSSMELSKICYEYGIILSHSSNYYTQGNGLAESNIQNFMMIIKEVVGNNKKSWDSKIKHALWVDRIMKKESTRKRPFELVYGMDVTLSFHLKILVYRLCYLLAQR